MKKSKVKYHKEMYLTNIEKKWEIDLSSILAEGTSTKRWDFVVKTASSIYVIETNFYTSGGSKLNETARSYKMIAEEAKDISGFRFIWITDGGEWTSAKRNLKKPSMYWTISIISPIWKKVYSLYCSSKNAEYFLCEERYYVTYRQFDFRY